MNGKSGKATVTISDQQDAIKADAQRCRRRDFQFAGKAVVAIRRKSNRQFVTVREVGIRAKGHEDRVVWGERARVQLTGQLNSQHERRTAKFGPVCWLGRQHGQRGLRMWAEPDGMVAGRFRLTPEVGSQVKAAVDAQVRRIFREHKGKDHEPHHVKLRFFLASENRIDVSRIGRMR